MVDIIKILPHVPTSFPSNIHNLRSQQFCQQIPLPIYLSNTNNISQNDRSNNIHIKRWIANSPTNPSRLLDVSESPYSLHRKIMYQELSRQYPTTVDLSRSTKSKQQGNTNKDTTKSTITITSTAGTNISSQPSFSNGDIQSSRLFDTLSKHVTIKAEPLRPSNNFINSATNTLTSWQRYWTSTHAQRRRKEANEPEPVLYRPKREQPMPGQTHFVVLRDSPHPYSELYQYDSQTPSTPPTNYSPNKSHISTPLPDKQISPIKENDIKKEANQISTIEFDALSLIPSSIEITSSIVTLKTSTTIPSKSADKEDEKYLTEKSLLLSPSQFKSDSQIIEDVSKGQIQSIPITATVYKLSLPTDQPKKIKRSPSRRRSRSKSKEKKELRTLSAANRKHSILTIPRSASKSGLSTIMTTIPREKYSQAKWDEPYVGLRFDPPTPRCSPSLLVYMQDSDPEDNDTTYERSEVFERKVSES